jgi:hypothetical protein
MNSHAHHRSPGWSVDEMVAWSWKVDDALQQQDMLRSNLQWACGASGQLVDEMQSVFHRRRTSVANTELPLERHRLKRNSPEVSVLPVVERHHFSSHRMTIQNALELADDLALHYSAGIKLGQLMSAAAERPTAPSHPPASFSMSVASDTLTSTAKRTRPISAELDAEDKAKSKKMSFSSAKDRYELEVRHYYMTCMYVLVLDVTS